MALDTIIALPARAGLPRCRHHAVRAAPDLPAIAEHCRLRRRAFNYIATGRTPTFIARLNSVIVTILNDPAYRARMVALGEEPTPSTPEELAATIAAESARWKQVIDSAGIHLE